MAITSSQIHIWVAYIKKKYIYRCYYATN
jgi:hypothetical protein